MKIQTLACSLLTLSVSLVGCGGGGGGGSSSNQPANTLVINEDNAPAVAAIVVASDFTGGIESGFDGAAAVSAIPEQKKYFEALEAGRSANATERFNETFACDVSGTLNLDITGSSNDGGDTVNFSGKFGFNNCSNDGDFFINGVLSTSGNLYGGGDRGNVNMGGSVSLREASSSKSVTIGGLSLKMDLEYDEYSYTQSYYVTGSLVEGNTFSVMTSRKVTGYIGAAPTDGVLTVNGAEGSSMTIEFDSGGAGVWVNENDHGRSYYSYEDLDTLSED
ncbi:hypothetical protein EUZ85_26625 [Hahella sp. KA22]|uniref:hypothetical protein n=1 Tax=Hahella sp. KA22 TaxID=1628392 RepID=UPI000FDF4A84|nr:hypothetical protein [Hahella sp. KA22]AZZ94098.1 hypothetical protein ENC22_24040 [Hahella sp. KA22]QAY57472.1 hypothetical protein EUZ85_26625 [Hahella sp. KA22]